MGCTSSNSITRCDIERKDLSQWIGRPRMNESPRARYVAKSPLSERFACWRCEEDVLDVSCFWNGPIIWRVPQRSGAVANPHRRTYNLWQDSFAKIVYGSILCRSIHVMLWLFHLSWNIVYGRIKWILYCWASAYSPAKTSEHPRPNIAPSTSHILVWIWRTFYSHYFTLFFFA